jgi:predicted XRE-type DNA-binding protein
MKVSKEALKLAKDLGLSEVDAYMMELKANLYIKSAELIKKSNKTHEQIAKEVGTSRARITRISNKGEGSLSIELLLKIIVCIEGKAAIKIAA